MHETRNSLSKIALFRDLPEETLDAIERKCQLQAYEAGDEIIGQFDCSRHVFLIVRGTVSVLIFSPEGRQVSFRELEEGQQFGEFAALDGALRSASVVARTDCCLAQLSGEEFRCFAHAHPLIMERLLTQAIALVRQLSARIFEFSTMAVNTRIRAELLRLAQTGEVHGDRVVIARVPTQEQIATRVSTSREAVSRELSELRKNGILERRGTSLVIHDLTALAKLLHDSVDLPIRSPQLPA